ncbi:hypothetical protein C8F04DRAFT_1114733 [Mycena alexandri]|uniref:Uncharacterized protein n=1 Tax=Mycena alexandri TaxID=1745969 RepID=A0AAD6X0C1_9AGAR|nr:hypothetical protein C8F04DRAFT_1114733 [Mycena alexandri]
MKFRTTAALNVVGATTAFSSLPLPPKHPDRSPTGNTHQSQYHRAHCCVRCLPNAMLISNIEVPTVANPSHVVRHLALTTIFYSRRVVTLFFRDRVMTATVTSAMNLMRVQVPLSSLSVLLWTRHPRLMAGSRYMLLANVNLQARIALVHSLPF